MFPVTDVVPWDAMLIVEGFSDSGIRMGMAGQMK
jgi:hypothetical protein